MSLISKSPIYFGSFLVFHLTPLSFALVNIKPLLPGHVLVCPLRPARRLADLTIPETTDLFLTIRRVSRMIQRVYHGTSLNIAIQDGPEAGQTVPHLHAHIIPRRKGDMDRRGGNDAIYEMMEGREGNVERHLGELVEERRRRELEGEGEGEVDGMDEDGENGGGLRGVDNEGRKARTEAEMMEEAFALAREMEGEGVD
ncbi:hypothetical protein AJ79_07291 [Helicocarpus griseus UAMH5409]|uniref:Bis(5'-adenosyl)-triphosphatase n=1 Tax=Helicocarpus griseus UAMH5409 TaxID=1447875 RepID=A0A2B7X497_9EURO|nr:hypothetical protein AJ79_07291 [Helicocarpus griseus UAMH5409]